MLQISTRVSREESLNFKREDLELLNFNMLSLSLSSVKNKMVMMNNQLRSYSTLRYISRPYIYTPTHGHIYLSLQSSSHHLVDLLIIRFFQNPGLKSDTHLSLVITCHRILKNIIQRQRVLAPVVQCSNILNPGCFPLLP